MPLHQIIYIEGHQTRFRNWSRIIILESLPNKREREMSPEMVGNLPGNDAAGMNFEETELTLGLPGECRSQSSGGTKRGFSETVELKLGSSVDESCEDGENSEISQTAKSPTTK